MHSTIVGRALVLPVRDDRSYAPLAQVLSKALDAVSLVTRQTLWTATRSPYGLGDLKGSQQGFDTRGFVLRSGRHVRDQRHALAVSNQMEFRSKPASAAAQGMVVGFLRVAWDAFFPAPAAARDARMWVPSTHHRFQSK